MVIAVDFDRTLSLDARYPDIGRPNEKLFKWLIEKQANGAKIILWTCRGYGSHLLEAVEWCKEHGLVFDAVNENLDSLGFDSRKIVADLYIDDLAINVDYFTE